MKIERYLDALMEAQNLKTDRQLAEVLGVRPNTVSQWRAGTRTVENEMCLRLAQLLGLEDPVQVIMSADMDRAERAGQRSLWEVFSKRMASSAAPATLAVLAAGVTNFVTGSPLQANAGAALRWAHLVLC